MYYITEKQALEKSNANSFREISKEKILDFMSMLPDMEPEVAKKALEQFPNFISYSTQVLNGYKETIEQAINCDGDNFQIVVGGRQAIIDSLSHLLKSEELSFEEKMEVAKRMTELADKNSSDYSKHQNHQKEMIGFFTMLIGVFFGAVLTALGGRGTIRR